MRRLERALEELGGYRKAVGRSTTPDFNEEDRLRADLHTSEAQKRQLGQDSQALANLVLDLAHKQDPSHQDAIHQGDAHLLHAFGSFLSRFIVPWTQLGHRGRKQCIRALVGSVPTWWFKVHVEQQFHLEVHVEQQSKT